MKKQLLPIIILFACITGVHAQKLTLNNYVEQTKISTKMGTAIGVALPHQFTVGGFYQKSIQKIENEPFRPAMEETEFFGVYFTGNLFQSQKLTVDTMVRTGVTNRENFAITPSVLVNYDVAKFIKINGGFGVRCFTPTLMAGIQININ